MLHLPKIVVIGPESTGKSTLSAALAAALGTVWVEEYARRYLQDLGRAYTEDDLLHIAREQLALEDKSVPRATKALVCDTDLHVVKVWSQAKYGRCHRWILEQIAMRKYDMYLLTDIDIPWQEDPLREHPAPAERLYFYNLYKDIVQLSGLPWAAVSGNEAQRLATAMQAVDKFLNM